MGAEPVTPATGLTSLIMASMRHCRARCRRHAGMHTTNPGADLPPTCRRLLGLGRARCRVPSGAPLRLCEGGKRGAGTRRRRICKASCGLHRRIACQSALQAGPGPGREPEARACERVRPVASRPGSPQPDGHLLHRRLPGRDAPRRDVRHPALLRIACLSSMYCSTSYRRLKGSDSARASIHPQANLRLPNVTGSRVRHGFPWPGSRRGRCVWLPTAHARSRPCCCCCRPNVAHGANSVGHLTPMRRCALRF